MGFQSSAFQANAFQSSPPLPEDITLVGVRYSAVSEVAANSKSFGVNQTVPAGGYLVVNVGHPTVSQQLRNYPNYFALLLTKPGGAEVNCRVMEMLSHAAQSQSVGNASWLVELAEDLLPSYTLTIESFYSIDRWAIQSLELACVAGKEIVVRNNREFDDHPLGMPNAAPYTFLRAMSANRKLLLGVLAYRGPQSLTSTPEAGFSVIDKVGTANTPDSANITLQSVYAYSNASSFQLDYTMGNAVWYDSVLFALEAHPRVDSAPYTRGKCTFYGRTPPDGSDHLQGEILVPYGKSGDWLVVSIMEDSYVSTSPPEGLALLEAGTTNTGLQILVRRLTDRPRPSGTLQPHKYATNGIYDANNWGWISAVIAGHKDQLLDSGTATGGSTTSLDDQGKSWTAGQFAGAALCVIEFGPGAGQQFVVETNSSNSLTPRHPLTTPVGAGSGYKLYKLPFAAYKTLDNANPLTWPSATPGFDRAGVLLFCQTNYSLGQDDGPYSAPPDLAVGGGNGVSLLQDNGGSWWNGGVWWGKLATNATLSALEITFEPGQTQNNPAGTPTPTNVASWMVLLLVEPATLGISATARATGVRPQTQAQASRGVPVFAASPRGAGKAGAGKAQSNRTVPTFSQQSWGHHRPPLERSSGTALPPTYAASGRSQGKLSRGKSAVSQALPLFAASLRGRAQPLAARELAASAPSVFAGAIRALDRTALTRISFSVAPPLHAVYSRGQNRSYGRSSSAVSLPVYAAQGRGQARPWGSRLTISHTRPSYAATLRVWGKAGFGRSVSVSGVLAFSANLWGSSRSYGQGHSSRTVPVFAVAGKGRSHRLLVRILGAAIPPTFLARGQGQTRGQGQGRSTTTLPVYVAIGQGSSRSFQARGGFVSARPTFSAGVRGVGQPHYGRTRASYGILLPVTLELRAYSPFVLSLNPLGVYRMALESAPPYWIDLSDSDQDGIP